jgi:hypothetical protein
MQEIRSMMGERRVMQEALFYGFSLERRVPDNHLLRKIDRFVDLSEVRAHLGPYYSDVGRPSIDPGLMIRMLIVGYCFGIRSERVRGGPSQSGLSLILSIGARRRRSRPFDIFQEPPRPFPRERSFAQAVRDGGGALHEGGIVGGEAFAVDASMIVADAATALGDTVVRRRHYGRPLCANSGHCPTTWQTGQVDSRIKLLAR